MAQRLGRKSQIKEMFCYNPGPGTMDGGTRDVLSFCLRRRIFAGLNLRQSYESIMNKYKTFIYEL